MVDRAYVIDEWQRDRKRVVVVGRSHPGGPKSWLRADGEWEPLSEAATPDDSIGFLMPNEALAAIVAAAGDTAPEPATARHLQDAIDVRDRLLVLVEKRR